MGEKVPIIGARVGLIEGTSVGSVVDGLADGRPEGLMLGCPVGALLGDSVGFRLTTSTISTFLNRLEGNPSRSTIVRSSSIRPDSSEVITFVIIVIMSKIFLHCALGACLNTASYQEDEQFMV